MIALIRMDSQRFVALGKAQSHPRLWRVAGMTGVNKKLSGQREFFGLVLKCEAPSERGTVELEAVFRLAGDTVKDVSGVLADEFDARV